MEVSRSPKVPRTMTGSDRFRSRRAHGEGSPKLCRCPGQGRLIVPLVYQHSMGAPHTQATGCCQRALTSSQPGAPLPPTAEGWGCRDRTRRSWSPGVAPHVSWDSYLSEGLNSANHWLSPLYLPHSFLCGPNSPEPSLPPCRSQG